LNLKQAILENKLNNTDFAQIMNTWTKQMGHPVVQIRKTSANEITLTQEHFLLNPLVQPSETSEYKLVSWLSYLLF
jgi:aminopeptidase N